MPYPVRMTNSPLLLASHTKPMRGPRLFLSPRIDGSMNGIGLEKEFGSRVSLNDPNCRSYRRPMFNDKLGRSRQSSCTKVAKCCVGMLLLTGGTVATKSTGFFRLAIVRGSFGLKN